MLDQKKMRLALCLIVVALLSGCGANVNQPTIDPANVETPEAIPAAALSETDAYSLYYETSDYPLGLYEPKSGCYTGSYVLSSGLIDYDMNTFDAKTQKKHAVSVYYLKAGNPFPFDWVKNCIDTKKTPYIAVYQPNAYNPYDHALVDEMAEAFGAYYVPVFVEFYPTPGRNGADPQTYINFYRYARSVFRENASNTAFVWSVDTRDVLDAYRFYPGDDWVDWVGMRAIERLDNGIFTDNLFSALDHLYYTYQKVKPIMLSGLAVSHYSSSDHIYQNTIAASEITRVYEKIINEYPRVKLINYLDYSEITAANANSTADNFLVTENEALLSAYRDSVSDNRYLSTLQNGNFGQTTSQILKSPFPAQKKNNALYVSASCFQYDLNTQGLTGATLIHGQPYYDLNRYLKNGSRTLTVDEEQKTATLWLAR